MITSAQGGDTSNPWPSLIRKTRFGSDQNQLEDEILTIPVADFLSSSRSIDKNGGRLPSVTLGSMYLGKKFTLDDNADRRKTI